MRTWQLEYAHVDTEFQQLRRPLLLYFLECSCRRGLKLLYEPSKPLTSMHQVDKR